MNNETLFYVLFFCKKKNKHVSFTEYHDEKKTLTDLNTWMNSRLSECQEDEPSYYIKDFKIIHQNNA